MPLYVVEEKKEERLKRGIWMSEKARKTKGVGILFVQFLFRDVAKETVFLVEYFFSNRPTNPFYPDK